MTGDMEAVLRRIVENGKSERCLVARDDDGNVIDVISLADLDDDGDD